MGRREIGRLSFQDEKRMGSTKVHLSRWYGTLSSRRTRAKFSTEIDLPTYSTNKGGNRGFLEMKARKNQNGQF